MELYIELLRHLFENQSIQVSFPNLQTNIDSLLQQQSYQILQEIVAVIKNDDLDDGECFARIEQIVSLLEENGIDTGSRHDFG